VTGESVESARRDLEETILPALVGLEVESLEGAADALARMLDGVSRSRQAAFCAAELALLDWIGRRQGRSAGEAIGPLRRAEVRYGGVVATEDLEAAKQLAQRMREFGLADVKVKVGPSLERNLRLLETVREALGDAVGLRVDANAAWTAPEALEQLEAMARFRLEAVEQPVAAADVEGMRIVTAARLFPVVADESLCSIEDARSLIETGACDVFNVRISKCGGLLNAARIHRLAVESGIGCQLGAQVGETGILSAAGRHYATRCEGVRWCEGSYGRFLLEDDPTAPDVAMGRGGHARAIEGPGLGVDVLTEKLVRLGVEDPSVI
jgi:muconate cycloisomerase